MSSKPNRAEVFARNAEALKRTQPSLAAGMLEISPADLERFDEVRMPEVKDAEYRRFARQAREQTSGDALVLLGMGTPRMLELLREELPSDRGLVVIEPTLELAMRLLSQNPYHSLLESPYAALVFGASDHSILSQVIELIADWGIGEMQLIANPMRPLGDDVARLVADLLQDAVRAVELQASTAAKFSEDTLAAIASNLDAACSAHDLSGLGKAMVGTPAFIIGAGPSLDADLAKLAGAAAKGIVIAADAAVPSLVKAGITPDIVTTIDVLEDKAEIFERHYVKGALLMALLSAHPKIVRAWIGPRAFAIDDHPLSLWAAPFIAPVSHFSAMPNVAHLSFSLARGLGCDPVVLVGTDMAITANDALYATGVEHAPVDARQALTPEHLESLVEVAANDGGTTRTLANMATYIHILSHMAQAGGKTFNTALQGARIVGAEYRALKDVLDGLPDRQIERPLVGQPFGLAAVEAMRVRLKRRVLEFGDRLAEYATAAEALSDHADELREGIEAGSMSAEDALDSLKPYAEELAAYRDIAQLVEPLQPAVTIEINRLTRMSSGLMDDRARARTRLIALAGPCAGGAHLARFLEQKLRELSLRLERPLSRRLPRVADNDEP